MPIQTTSYSSKKRPRFRKNTGDVLPAGRARRQRKRGAQYLRHTPGLGGRGRRRPRRNSRRPYAVIAVACAFLVFLASILWYANRGVDITLNGSTVSVRINSSIETLIEDRDLSLKPGRLLAVDDTVLDKTGGEPFAATLNGKAVDPDRAADTKLAAGDEVTIENGKDTYEPHQVQATEIAPALTVKGSGALRFVQTWGEAGRQEVWTGERSGITQDRGVVKEPVGAVVATRGIAPSGGKKVVALTFNRAPSAGTDAILKILSEKGAKATFFVEGRAAESDSAAVAAIARAGHQVASNGYAGADPAALSGEELRAELAQGFAAVDSAGGGSTALYRPVSNEFSEQNWADAMDLVGAVVTYNLNSGDWTLPGADAVVETVVGGVSPGDIILMTDSDDTAEQTAAALPRIIDGLTAAGYQLVTVSDLIASDTDLSKELPDGFNLRKATMPEGASLPQVTKESDDSASA
ncbi:MAG: polysaccharide deacetylase family protein [Coriobacteriaceae bacterium]|nr:polysaccharide deacetylase family protein [Coriobacteriaceae bacterium]